MSNLWSSLLFETLEAGVSSALAPELLPDNQAAWGMNIDVRGGKPATRPGLRYRLTLPDGLVQGCEFFGVQNGMLVASIAGRMYRVRIMAGTFSYEEIPLSFVNSPIIKQVWMTQTVETLVIQDGQSNAILYDGSTATRSSGSQVPRGRQMAYGNGRLWVAVNANELVAGDIRTASAGSELLFTEATYLTGGGKLFFPSDLTALSFIPVTGQSDYGVLLAFGARETSAIRADITSRDDWGKVPGFVTSLLRSVGAASQWPVISINQDLYWRDSNGGLRSIRNALADEAGPGSAPISREVSRLTDYDSQQLLPWCSGVYFDNRVIVTSSPFLLPNGGIGWRDLIPLDFAPLSSMGGKGQPAYDGKWNGLTFVKLVAGTFGGRNRAFAIVTDENESNQLWEFEPGVGALREDSQVDCTDGTATVSPYRVRSFIEYPRRNFGAAKARKLLDRCDVWLSDVSGELDLQVYWRADNWQKWLLWDEATTCAKMTDGTSTTPHVWKNLKNQERPQFKTFTIPDTVNELVGYAANVGFEFQIRLVWRGQCRIHRVMVHGQLLDDPDYADRTGFSAACVENDVSDNQIDYAIPSTGCALCPIVTTEPVASSVDSPAGTSFSLAYEGDAESLQWQVSEDGGDTWANVTNGGIYSGATTTELTLASTSSDLNGNLYRCVLSRDGCGLGASGSAELTVACPVVTANPADRSIDEGTNTTFTAAASGSGNTYQWQVSTNGGTVWANVTNGTNYSGATTGTLSTLTTPLSFSTYKYRCIISHTGCPDLASNAATLTVVSGVTAWAMVVGGGGGGGTTYGGGGGGGDAQENTSFFLPTASYPVTIGAGGAGAANRNVKGSSGGTTTFHSFTALGGGGGGSLSNQTGASGACGGGGGGGGAGPISGAGGAGTAGGNGGAGKANGSSNASGGGGGGDAANGADAPSNSQGGAGGAGLSSSISGGTLQYGSGGGGAGGVGTLVGAGGGGTTSGGGAGGNNASGNTKNASDGAGLGGGGGGWNGVSDVAGGNGGKGVVIVRYAGSARFTGGAITTVSGNTVHTFTSSGTLAPV